MKKLFASLMYLTLFLAVAGLLPAATIQGTCDTFTTTSLSSTGNLTCTKFDSSLGTLTGIDILFSGTATYDLTVTSTHKSQPKTTDALNSTQFSSGALTGFNTGTPFSIALASGSNSYDAGTHRDFTLSGNGSATRSNSANLTSYQGVIGEFFTIPVTITGSAFVTSPAGGNFTTTQTNKSFITATITYTYNAADIGPGTDPSPVPEPGTALLFGLGLLGVAIGVRRKRQ